MFLALADADLVETLADALSEFTSSVSVLKPAPGVFRDYKNIRDVMEAGGRKQLTDYWLEPWNAPPLGCWTWRT